MLPAYLISLQKEGNKACPWADDKQSANPRRLAEETLLFCNTNGYESSFTIIISIFSNIKTDSYNLTAVYC